MWGGRNQTLLILLFNSVKKKKKKADMSGGVFFGFCFSYVKCYGLNLY